MSDILWNIKICFLCLCLLVMFFNFLNACLLWFFWSVCLCVFHVHHVFFWVASFFTQTSRHASLQGEQQGDVKVLVVGHGNLWMGHDLQILWQIGFYRVSLQVHNVEGEFIGLQCKCFKIFTIHHLLLKYIHIIFAKLNQHPLMNASSIRCMLWFNCWWTSIKSTSNLTYFVISKSYIVASWWLWHKLNYFSICWNFKKGV